MSSHDAGDWVRQGTPKGAEWEDEQSEYGLALEPDEWDDYASEQAVPVKTPRPRPRPATRAVPIIPTSPASVTSPSAMPTPTHSAEPVDTATAPTVVVSTEQLIAEAKQAKEASQAAAEQAAAAEAAEYADEDAARAAVFQDRHEDVLGTAPQDEDVAPVQAALEPVAVSPSLTEVEDDTDDNKDDEENEPTVVVHTARHQAPVFENELSAFDDNSTQVSPAVPASPVTQTSPVHEADPISQATPVSRSVAAATPVSQASPLSEPSPIQEPAQSWAQEVTPEPGEQPEPVAEAAAVPEPELTPAPEGEHTTLVQTATMSLSNPNPPGSAESIPQQQEIPNGLYRQDDGVEPTAVLPSSGIEPMPTPVPATELEEERRAQEELAAARAARNERLGVVETSKANETRTPPTRAKRTTDGALASLGIFFLRLVTAGILGILGYQALTGIDGVTEVLSRTLLPEPRLMAWIGGFTLAACAVLLMIGMLIRIVGFVMLAFSVVSLVFLRWGAFSPFVAGLDGFLGDRDLLLGAVGLLFLCIGGGAWGIDGAFRRARAAAKAERS